MNRLKNIITKINFEALLWSFALLYLLFINPYEVQEFTFCPFHNMGIEYCPGCGLGRSISFLYHGDLTDSFQTHPLGIAAFVLILLRIIKLAKQTINNFQQPKRGASWQTSTN
jgi:hypothetical protein